MDAPSTQLVQDIRDSIVRGLATRRPILHHLNADASWLLQVPRPAAAIRHGTRIYYNILIDPWLSGGRSDVAHWFSQQWHTTGSKVGSVAQIEELAREIEILAGGLRLGKGRLKNGETGANVGTFVDAVAISHEFTDHCHKETLLEVERDVPVFATEKAAALIHSWNHFRSVNTIIPFTGTAPDWQDGAMPPLPEWLSISQLVTEKDSLYSHSALLIAFNTTPSTSSSASSVSDAAEAVIYTPHGIPAAALLPVSAADPPIHTLAFLHGLHAVPIGPAQQLNLGAHNRLEAQRILKAKYWVGTHNEVRKGGGLVNWFLRKKIYTVKQAVEEERRWIKRANGDVRMANGRLKNSADEWDDVRFEEVGNGESRVLE